jgi:D-3-phosphoglycerate dehydrogenase
MPGFVIAVTDSPFPSLDPAKAALARIDPELRMAKSAAAEDILAVARDADAVLVTYAKLPGELLRQLTRCKAIGRFGLGVDNIDIKAAAELGIIVTYVPFRSTVLSGACSASSASATSRARSRPRQKRSGCVSSRTILTCRRRCSRPPASTA